MRFLIPALAMLLTACAQDYGGITKVEYDADTGKVDLISGKEYEEGFDVEFTRAPDGTVTAVVKAGGVQAFEGQQIQADRIVGLAEAITPTVEGIVERILCAYFPTTPNC